MKRTLSTAAIVLMLLLNPFSTPRINATNRCGQATPSGRVAVRIGFSVAGETTRISHIRETVREAMSIELEICDIHSGALPPIPVLQVPGNFTQSEAAELISNIRRYVGGVRVYQSNGTIDSDWTSHRIRNTPN
jgi:hypothetical protein